MSSSRSSRSLPAARSRRAPSAASPATSAAWLSLPPKPPPMRRHLDRHGVVGSPSTWATTCCTSVGCWVEAVDQHVAVLARERPWRSGLRGRNAPARRCAARPAARCGAAPARPAASPRAMLMRRQHAGSPPRWPRSIVSTGVSGFDTRRAPARGAARLVAGVARPRRRTAAGRGIRPARRRASARRNDRADVVHAGNVARRSAPRPRRARRARRARSSGEDAGHARCGQARATHAAGPAAPACRRRSGASPVRARALVRDAAAGRRRPMPRRRDVGSCSAAPLSGARSRARAWNSRNSALQQVGARPRRGRPR